MKIVFCHHLSLSYDGGGEKWIVQLSRELMNRGHSIEIFCLPFKLKDGGAYDFKRDLGNIPYHEGYFHYVSADVAYVTYNPLNWLNFYITCPKIGGMHSHAYWKPINPSYGLLPNLAILANALTSR